MTAAKGTPGYEAQRASLAAQVARVLARRAEWVAQVEAGAAAGATVASVAAECRLDRATVTARLRRAERRDLIAVLVDNARPPAEAVVQVSAVVARRAAFVEDAVWMAETGETAEGAAARFGMEPKALYRRLLKLGRPDVWESLSGSAATGTGVRAGRIASLRGAA